MFRLKNVRQYAGTLSSLGLFAYTSYSKLYPALPDDVTPTTAIDLLRTHPPTSVQDYQDIQVMNAIDKLRHDQEDMFRYPNFSSENSEDHLPQIEVSYQTEEKGMFTHVLLTREQSTLLRELIQNSPKQDIFKTLTKIVLLAGDSTGNVQLFTEGKPIPKPYNFDPSVIKDKQLLPAIIETIMFSEKRMTYHFAMSNLLITDDKLETAMRVETEARESLGISPEVSLNILKFEYSPAVTVDGFEHYYLIYPNKGTLNLTSQQCFESLVMDDEPEVRFGPK